MTTVEKELRKGDGFMLRLKRRWGEHYSEKNLLSKQILRDNATRLKKDSNMNFGSEETQIEKEDGTTWIAPTSGQPKVNLLKIQERENYRGCGFMKKVKKTWDDTYKEICDERPNTEG